MLSYTCLEFSELPSASILIIKRRCSLVARSTENNAKEEKTTSGIDHIAIDPGVDAMPYHKPPPVNIQTATNYNGLSSRQNMTTLPTFTFPWSRPCQSRSYSYSTPHTVRVSAASTYGSGVPPPSLVLPRQPFLIGPFWWCSELRSDGLNYTRTIRSSALSPTDLYVPCVLPCGEGARVSEIPAAVADKKEG